VKCHCYPTQKQHTTVMQPSGAKTTQTQHRNTRHNDISLLWPERGNREFILEFTGIGTIGNLYHDNSAL
jgi:hypothetical protein